MPAKNRNTSWSAGIWMGLDQFGNAAFAPLANWMLKPPIERFGNPDRTLSHVIGVNRQEAIHFEYIARVLDFFDNNHTADAIGS